MTLLTAYWFSLSLIPSSFTLESAPEESLALVGVALANSLGSGVPRSHDIPVDLPSDVPIVQDALNENALAGSGFFEEHFFRISELNELLSIEVVSYLRLHPDKRVALENYITQLSEKKDEADEALASLNQLQSIHTNALPGLQASIKNTQSVIETAYNNRDGWAIIDDLSRLEELRIEEQEHKNVAVFASRIAIEYSTLVSAMSERIVVLQANIAPLVQGITVKLPTSVSIDALKELKIFATDTQ